MPSFTALAVTNLLRDEFGDFVDAGFTAEMEEDLDEISNGERDWLDFVKAFYRGKAKERRGLEPAVTASAGQANYPVIEIGVDPADGAKVVVRIGRFGPFLQVGDGGPGRTASLPEEMPPSDLTIEQALALVKKKAAGPRSLGVDPASGKTVYAAHGRFGPYVQLGEAPDDKDAPKPRRASLTGEMTETGVTLDEALRLLSLPRELGAHPTDGATVLAGMGRFGPYVRHGDEFRSLEPEDDVYTIGIERAVVLLAAPKRSRRQRAQVKTVLRELGARPGGGATIQLLSGRYGPYVSDGTTNASLPRDADPNAFTIEQAVALIETRAASPKPARRRAVGKRRPAKK